MKKRDVKRILYWGTVTVLIAIIVVCGFLIGKKFVDDAQDKAVYSDIQAEKDRLSANSTRPSIPDEPIIVPTDPTEEDETIVTGPIVESDILFEYRAFYEINNDMVGWIEIEGTDINYPVVQSPYSANFYLRRNFYKEYATCGTIYAREACDINKPSDNITLYGHNMGNGTMFADLHLYENKSFWEDNKYIYFDTLTEKHTYEIFAVFITTADLGQGFSYHLFSDTKDAAKFADFVNTCQELSLYDTGIEPKYGEKLLTLSTCDKSVEDGRLVVVARRLV